MSVASHNAPTVPYDDRTSLTGLLAMPLVFVVVASYFAYQRVSLKRKWREIAQDLGAQYGESTSDTSGHVGITFEKGHTRTIRNLLTWEGGARQTGALSYITKSGKSRQEHSCQFFKYSLPRKVPHILIVNKRSRFNPLPYKLKNDEKMKLGGFNNWFDVVVPKNYQRDALQILTPNVMEAIMNHSKKNDIELVGDSLYFYMDKLNPEDLTSTIQDTNTVYEKLLRQVERYSDFRVGHENKEDIHVDGLRLQRKFSPLVITIISTGFIILGFILGLLLG
jgi:hypothetical protein